MCEAFVCQFLCVSGVCVSRVSVSCVCVSRVSVSGVCVSRVSVSGVCVSRVSVSGVYVSRVSVSGVCVSRGSVSGVSVSGVCVSRVSVSGVCVSRVSVSSVDVILVCDSVIEPLKVILESLSRTELLSIVSRLSVDGRSNTMNLLCVGGLSPFLPVHITVGFKFILSFLITIGDVSPEVDGWLANSLSSVVSVALLGSLAGSSNPTGFFGCNTHPAMNPLTAEAMRNLFLSAAMLSAGL